MKIKNKMIKARRVVFFLIALLIFLMVFYPFVDNFVVAENLNISELGYDDETDLDKIEAINKDHENKRNKLVPVGDLENLYVINNVNDNVVKVSLKNYWDNTYLQLFVDNPGRQGAKAYYNLVKNDGALQEVTRMDVIENGLISSHILENTNNLGQRAWDGFKEALKLSKTVYGSSMYGTEGGALLMTDEFFPHFSWLYQFSNLVRSNTSELSLYYIANRLAVPDTIVTSKADLILEETPYLYLYYEPTQYNIVFNYRDNSGSWSSEKQQLIYNDEIINLPVPPTLDHARFLQWDSAERVVTGDMSFKAEYAYDYFEVAFFDNDDGQLNTTKRLNYYDKFLGIVVEKVVGNNVYRSSGYSLIKGGGLVDISKLNLSEVPQLYIHWTFDRYVNDSLRPLKWYEKLFKPWVVAWNWCESLHVPFLGKLLDPIIHFITKVVFIALNAFVLFAIVWCVRKLIQLVRGR